MHGQSKSAISMRQLKFMITLLLAIGCALLDNFHNFVVSLQKYAPSIPNNRQIGIIIWNGVIS